MRKKHIILSVYILYVALLFLLTIYFEHLDTPNNGFLSLGLVIRFILINFFSSCIVSIICFSIYKHFSISFIILAPLVNVFSGIFSMLVMNFILWITQLEKIVSDYEHIFLITSFATMTTILWMNGEVFRNKLNSDKNDEPACRQAG